MHDSQTLYDACRQEGSAAQVEAFEALWSQLYRLAYRMVWERPGGEDLAGDCAQQALIKIHRSLESCRNPGAFREWAAQVLRRVVIDELRRPEHRRRAALPDDEEHAGLAASAAEPAPSDELRGLLEHAIANGPLSDRSRRVVAGRYFQEQSDEVLARVESDLAGQQVLPSHIQVTRAKNLASLRRDSALLSRLRELSED